jgi:hypothetical protein
MTTPTSNQTELPQRYVAAELNLSRLPFFASSTKNLRDKRSITYTDTITHQGEKIDLVWEVTSNAKYGYPGPFAESVHMALLDIVTEQGLPFENPVVFSFYDLCKRLDIQHNGKNISAIRNAILSIRLAAIVIENSFVTKDGRRLSFTPDPTSLYKRTLLYGSKDERTGEKVDFSAVWLSDFYLRSLNTGNIRPIDFEYFKRLHGQSYAATKIYQYLGYRFAGAFNHDNDYTKVDYDDLAVIADIKRQPYLSQAKQKLKKAHEALVNSGFVQQIEWEQQKRSDAPTKFYIFYYPGDRARGEYQNGRYQLNRKMELPLLGDRRNHGEEGDFETAIDQSTDVGKNTTTVLAPELEKLGVTAKRAKELDEQYSEERITRQLDHLDFLSERGKSPDNPAAWLVSAIRNDYETPDGFKTREQRKAEERARARAARRKQQQRQEEQNRQEQKEAHRQELDRRLSECSEETQEDIEATIIERLKQKHQTLIRSVFGGKEIDPKSTMFEGEYYEHLEELLDEREGT